MVSLKIRWRSPKSYQIIQLSQWYNTLSFNRIHHLVQEIGCRQAFLVKISHSKCWCDLENDVKVTKSNHFFPRPNNVYASLVKIHQLVQKIEWRQEATQTRTLTGSTPKAICLPSPLVVGTLLWLGDIIIISLNFRSLFFIADRSLFFITLHWFLLWMRWTGDHQ